MFEIIPHTADVRLRVAAATVEELFRDAVKGLMACLEAHPDYDSTTIYRDVEVGSVDRTTLLVDFLNAVLGLAIVEREMYRDVHFRSIGPTELAVSLVGTRATFGDEVKAVTYHEADVAQSAGGTWSTLLVLDV